MGFLQKARAALQKFMTGRRGADLRARAFAMPGAYGKR